MLTPIFFPFSHMTQTHARSILAFFPRFRYLPLTAGSGTAPGNNPGIGQLIREGKILPEYHSQKELTAIDSQVQSFRDWAGIHRGNEKNLKAFFKQTPYFTDDTDLTQIQSQLRARVSGRQETRKTHDNPLLFLKLAQILDSENEAIDTRLKDLEKGETKLFSTLKGLTDSDETGDTGELDHGGAVPVTGTPEQDPGAVMTGERIRSWLRVARGKGMFENGESPTVLVTTSQAVFDHVMADEKDVINGLDIESIKVHEGECPLNQNWQIDFCRWIGKWMTGRITSLDPMEISLPEVKDECHLGGRIQLGKLKGDQGFLDESENNIPGRSMGLCLVRLKS